MEYLENKFFLLAFTFGVFFFVTCLAEKDWMGGVKPDPAYHCRVDSVFEIYRHQL